MLVLQVTAFSRWEKELPKLVADDRYKAIANMKDRKAAFEEYCKDTAEQRRRSKPSAGGHGVASSSAEAKSGFRSLLDEASTRPCEGQSSSCYLSQRMQKLSLAHRLENPPK